MVGQASSLREFRLYIEGFDTKHSVSEFIPPKLTQKTETMHMGTFESEVFMGLEKLTCEMTFYSLSTDFIEKWGLLNNTTGQFISLRGIVENNRGVSSEIKIDMRGAFKEVDFGTWKKGDLNTIKVGATLWQYNYIVDNLPLIQIDLDTNTYIIGGKNQLPKHKEALGLL